MTKFAFIVHPLTPRSAAKKYPILRYLPERLIEAILKRKKPIVVSEIRGVRSSTGAETQGWFIGCPLTPKQMTTLPLEFVYKRIGECCKLAEDLGAQIIGLGAFTSVVGDGGITIKERTPLAVTTGNSYTTATAIEGTLHACELLGIEPRESVLAVVGATGSIGKTCAIVLGRQFGRTILVGRDAERTRVAAEQIEGAEATTDIARLREADAIITVTSSDAAVILPEHLKPGCVVCDVARPRDVSTRVGKERPDVLVIEGGVVRVPGNVEFGFDFGFPPHTAYACMSETMMLALDDRPESFTLGKDVTVEQVEESLRLAAKHGFELAGFRSFERPVDEEAIQRARAARAQLSPSAPRTPA